MKRSNWLHASFAGIALFALYAATAPRAVMMEDDGSFILASHFLGIAHPPGYPLFTLLGKLYTLLPVGSVAYRVHLLSATFGALTGAVIWLCARALIDGRLPAYIAAFGLGLAPVFWSQAIIAEVYTLNTFFFAVLLYLGLAPQKRRAAPAMALLFGLSLSNHWPLMLLAAPAFAVLLWPRAGELVRRLPLLAALVLLGLLPYAWMAILSQRPLPVSFSGPIGSLAEFWFFVSRAGYAEVDVSQSATWLDRIRYFGFVGREVLLQFAVAGALLAAAGFWAQWRQWGNRISACLSIAFLMPTIVLVLLLGFDYDAFHKHVFHVYPLPAYAVAALWMALGFHWLARRLDARPAAAVAGGVALLGLILALGLRQNQLSGYAWPERYAAAVLRALPADAIVLVKGADIGPLGYLHLVEGRRPDVTLYHPQGLVLGNRLFHPLRTDQASQEAAVRALIERSTGPVASTAALIDGYSWRDHWLFATLDRPGRAGTVSVDIPPDLAGFFEDEVLGVRERNAFITFFQGELRRRYAGLLAQSLPPAAHADPQTRRRFDTLSQDFFGAMGATEGLLSNPHGYSMRQAIGFLDRARDLMPSDASKRQQARFFELRSQIRRQLGDSQGARTDLETAAATSPRGVKP